MRALGRCTEKKNKSVCVCVCVWRAVRTQNVLVICYDESSKLFEVLFHKRNDFFFPIQKTKKRRERSNRTYEHRW